MGFLATLKKLGIIKTGGAAAVYTNAKDRPLSFSDEGGFEVTETAAESESKTETSSAKPAGRT